MFSPSLVVDISPVDIGRVGTGRFVYLCLHTLVDTPRKRREHCRLEHLLRLKSLSGTNVDDTIPHAVARCSATMHSVEIRHLQQMFPAECYSIDYVDRYPPVIHEFLPMLVHREPEEVLNVEGALELSAEQGGGRFDDNRKDETASSRKGHAA